MRYISLFIGGILALASCNEVKVSGNGENGRGTLYAGFRDTVVTLFENMGTGTLNVDFSQPLTQDTRIVLSVSEEENMQENKDYFIPAKELSVAVGKETVEVNYSLVDDNVANDTRGFTLKLVSVNGGVVETLASRVKVKVLDDESDVAVGFATTAFTVSEREPGSVQTSYLCQIPIKVFGTLRKPIQFKVAVHTVDDPDAAVEHVNFNLPESVFVIEDTTLSITVPVKINDDQEVNIDRVFALDITEVTGGEIYTPQKRCMVTIKNDDMGIYFGQTEMEAEERAGVVRIPVKLTGVTDQPMAFGIACSGSAVDGTDYNLVKTWTIEAGKDSVEIEVELKDLPGVTPDRVLELQFAQVADGVQIFDRGRSCELRILDCNSVLRFEKTNTMVFNDSTSFSLPVELSEPVAHDITFKVNVTAREGLSEEQASIVKSEITIPAGSVSARVELALRKLAIKNKANLRIEISEVYGSSISENTCTVTKYYKYQTTDLAIASFTTEEKSGEGAGNGCAVNAIDGATDKYWHSVWQGGEPQLPEGIVVTLPDNAHVIAVEIVRRVATSNSDLRELKLYLSKTTTEFLVNDDGTAWGEAIGTLEWEKTGGANVGANTRTLELSAPQTAKYLKLACTQSWRNNNAQIAEVVVYGYTE